MFLPDEFIERSGAHPGGKRGGCAGALLDFVFSFLKQILHGVKNTKHAPRRTCILWSQDRIEDVMGFRILFIL